MKAEDLDVRFAFHPARLLRVAEHDKVREGCRLLAHGLNDVLPEGREKSLALTNLEQVMFWSNAALARQDDTL